MKISVVLPAYNAEVTLVKSLDSLLRQTLCDFEVIIIDDGSSDNTSRVAKDYILKDKRIRYYYQENSGVSMARNKGIELSNGEYICFLDSDDYYENTFIEKMYNKISRLNNDVCYCGYNIVINNIIKRKKTEFVKDDVLLKQILNRVNIHTTGWMIKKKHIEQNNIRFPKGVAWGEDFEFFNEVVATTNKICFVDEYLTNYRVAHDVGQLSHFSLDKIDKDFESIMRMVNNKRVNKNKKIEKALIDYRLQALIIYRLTEAINRKIDINEIKYYYEKYKKYIVKPTFNNGLRSVKLNLNRIKLFRAMI